MGLGGILGFSEAGIDAMLLGEGLALAPETFGASIALAGLMVGVAKLKQHHQAKKERKEDQKHAADDQRRADEESANQARQAAADAQRRADEESARVLEEQRLNEIARQQEQARMIEEKRIKDESDRAEQLRIQEEQARQVEIDRVEAERVRQQQINQARISNVNRVQQNVGQIEVNNELERQQRIAYREREVGIPQGNRPQFQFDYSSYTPDVNDVAGGGPNADRAIDDPMVPVNGGGPGVDPSWNFPNNPNPNPYPDNPYINPGPGGNGGPGGPGGPGGDPNDPFNNNQRPNININNRDPFGDMIRHMTTQIATNAFNDRQKKKDAEDKKAAESGQPIQPIQPDYPGMMPGQGGSGTLQPQNDPRSPQYDPMAPMMPGQGGTGILKPVQPADDKVDYNDELHLMEYQLTGIVEGLSQQEMTLEDSYVAIEQVNQTIQQKIPEQVRVNPSQIYSSTVATF